LLTKAALLIMVWASSVTAHEMTPAYPKIKPSYVSGVAKVEMSIFNYRSDVKYYQVDVFDAAWSNVPFSTQYKVLKVNHSERNNFNVYIRKADLKRAVYLCTTSKVKKQVGVNTLVSSRICSRLDGAKP